MSNTSKSRWFSEATFKEDLFEIGSLVRGLKSIEEFPEAWGYYSLNRFNVAKVDIIRLSYSEIYYEVMLNQISGDKVVSESPLNIEEASVHLSQLWLTSPTPSLILRKTTHKDEISVSKYSYSLVFSISRELIIYMKNIDNVDDEEILSSTVKILSQYLSIFTSRVIPYSEKLVDSVPNKLTDRQALIASMLSKGWGNKKIAQELGFSESLIRKETMVIFRFYGITSRSEMAAQPQ